MAKRRRNRSRLTRFVFIALLVAVIYFMTRKVGDERSADVVPTDPPQPDPVPPVTGGGGEPVVYPGIQDLYTYPEPSGVLGSMSQDAHFGAEDTEGDLLTGDDTQAYTLPAAQNSINYQDLSDLEVTEDETYTLGFGAPLYSDIPNDESGKLILFKKGVQHIIHPNGFARSRWNPEHNHTFAFPQNTFKTAAIWANASGQWNTGIHGDLTPMMNISTNVIPYEPLTVAGAKLLGRFVADAVGSNNSIDDPQWNIPAGKSHTMFDCENEPDRGWAYGSITDFLGYIFEGIASRFEDLTGEVSPGKLELYGKAISWFKKSTLNFDSEDLTALANEAKNIILTNNHAYNPSIWTAKKVFIELGCGYFKTPSLENEVKQYAQNLDGSIKTANGVPVARTDQFTVSIFGKNVDVWQSPNDYIKWGIVNDTTGQQKLGWQAEWGAKNPGAHITTPPAGWHWGNWVNNNPANWRPESALYQNNMYSRADQMLFGFLMLRHASKGDRDISFFDPTQKMLPSIVDRPVTEPYTWKGNGVLPREIGPQALKYSVYLYFLSGGRLFSTWDDGGYPSPWPVMGAPLYGKNDNYSRYIPGLAAYQSIFKQLEGVDKSDLIYLHFYTPFLGHQKREVISSAIYVKSSGKLLFFAFNPSLENTQKQTVKIRAGASARRVVLNGREVRYKVISGLPTGLTKNDFSLEYKNIYGQALKKSGVLTEEFNNHYI